MECCSYFATVGSSDFTAQLWQRMEHSRRPRLAQSIWPDDSVTDGSIDSAMVGSANFAMAGFSDPLTDGTFDEATISSIDLTAEGAAELATEEAPESAMV